MPVSAISSLVRRFFSSQASVSRGRRVNKRNFSGAEQMETRILPAAMTLVPGGELRYTGSNTTADNLSISFDSGTGRYTFQDPVEAITVSGFTDLNAATNIVEFDPTTFASFTFVSINHRQGGVNQSTTINSFRAGGEFLSFTNNAGTTETLNINGDIGSSVTPAAGSLILNLDQTNIAAGVYATGEVRLVGPVSVTGNSTVTSTTSSVRAQSTIGGPNSLSIDAALFANLQGTIGGTTPLSSLDVTTVGNASFGSALVPTTVEVVNSLDIDAGGLVTVSGDLTSGGNLSITGSGVSLAGAIGFDFTSGGGIADQLTVSTGVNATSATATLTLNGGAGSTHLSGGVSGFAGFSATGESVILESTVIAGTVNVTATGLLESDALRATAGAMTVTGDVDFSTYAVGNILLGATTDILLSGAVEGNGATLQFGNANNITIGGALSNVGVLDVNRNTGTYTSVTTNSVSADTISIRATNVHLRGDITALVDDVFVQGNVLLDGLDLVVTLRSGLGTGDEVSITGNVNSGVPAHGLEMIAGDGLARMLGGGLVGNLAPLNSFLASASQVSVGTVAVAAGELILEGGILNLGGAGSLTGAGNMIFRPRLAGGHLQVHNLPTAPASADMVLGTNQLAAVSPGFAAIRFGGATAGTVTLFGDVVQSTAIDFSAWNAPVEFVGQNVLILERINLGGSSLLLSADGSASFDQNGLVLNGSVTIAKRTAGPGTLQVNGRRMAYSSAMPWGLFDLTFDGNGGDIQVNVEVNGIAGNAVDDLVVTANTTSIAFTYPTAVAANGNVTIDSDVSFSRGVYARTGSTVINGNVELTGAATWFAGNGGVITVNGDITANGNSITVRGFQTSDVIASVSINGDIVSAGAVLMIPNVGGSPIAQINVRDIASSAQLALRANTIFLDGDLTAANGNLGLTGSVQLVGDSSLVNTSVLASRLTRVDGTINGTHSLVVSSAAGTVVLAGAVGGTDPLQSLAVTSQGNNSLGVPVTVKDLFSWEVGNLTLSTDRLRVTGNITATEAGGQILLSAYRVDDLSVLNAGTVTIIEM